MRRKQNQKLYHTMMLSGLAFMLLCSFKASATEIPIFKCINPSGQVIFQDKACSEDYAQQMLSVEFNQSADVAPGLRSYEQILLKRSFDRQILERILNAQTAKR